MGSRPSDAAPLDADGRQRVREMAQQHLPKVWRFLRRLGLEAADADDGMQEVLLVAVRRVDDIRPGRELPFLLGTAFRVGCRLRARRRPERVQSLPDPLPHPDVLVDRKRARQLLDEILERMSTEQRTAFVLHDIEGLTMVEIAQALEISPATVASRLRRARDNFRRQIARIEAIMTSGQVLP